jgi:hypothetical protein
MLKSMIKIHMEIQYRTDSTPKRAHQLTTEHTRKLTLASPNTIYVSDAGFLYTSGLLITNRIFLDLRIVTLLTPCTYKEQKQHILFRV